MLPVKYWFLHHCSELLFGCLGALIFQIIYCIYIGRVFPELFKFCYTLMTKYFVLVYFKQNSNICKSCFNYKLFSFVILQGKKVSVVSFISKEIVILVMLQGKK